MGACFFSHPADVLKVRMQLLGEGNAQKPSVKLRDYLDTGRGMVAKEGVRRGLYAGLTPALLRHSVFSTLRHGLFKVAEEASGGMNAAQRLGTAMCTGALAGAVACPADVVMIRMQADGTRPEHLRRNYRNVFHGMRSVCQEEGLRACWLGVAPTTLRAMLVTSSQISAFTAAKPALEKHMGLTGLGLQMASAAVSGLTACVVTQPVDVVKTRIMQSPPKGTSGPRYTGPLDVVRKTLQTEGLFAFYKGLSATMLRLFPHTMALWTVQHYVDIALKDLM